MLFSLLKQALQLEVRTKKIIECLEQVLYTKERFGISGAAYHELSMVSPQLPRSWKLKQQSKSLNKQWDVNPTPESTTGVQQSLRSRLVERVHHLLRSSGDKPFEQHKLLRVELTGDGTYLGSLHVVTFGFSLIDEGCVAKSATGYHVLCILKETESYEPTPYEHKLDTVVSKAIE